MRVELLEALEPADRIGELLDGAHLWKDVHLRGREIEPGFARLERVFGDRGLFFDLVGLGGFALFPQAREAPRGSVGCGVGEGGVVQAPATELRIPPAVL